MRCCLSSVYSKYLSNGTVTYRNDHLGQSSFTDHVFVSSTLRPCVVDAVVLESGSNLSNHLPLVYTFRLKLCQSPTMLKDYSKPCTPYSWRWDKSDISLYYMTSQQAMSCLCDYPDIETCEQGCSNMSHKHSINSFYESLVCALHCVACRCIVRLPCKMLKPF